MVRISLEYIAQKFNQTTFIYWTPENFETMAPESNITTKQCRRKPDDWM